MFKAAHIVQVAIVLSLLGACASSKTAAPPADPMSAATPASPSAGSAASLEPVAGRAPIQSGVSTNSSDGVRDADGRLKPNLQAYAADVSRTRNIPLEHVLGILDDAQFNATVVRLMAPSK